ncbi:MAG: hypothetical protein AB1489_38580 [Acidobacteriota bacterium]
MRVKGFLLMSVVVCLFLGTANSVSSNGDNTTSVLPRNPSAEANVTISFDGLMALCFGNPDRVSVAILDVHHHLPTMTVSKIVNGHRSLVTVLNGRQLQGTLYIDVENRHTGVSKYMAASMHNDPNDFRWNIDMEMDLYQRELQLKEEKLFGKIHISTGLFYAVDLSKERVRFLATDGSGKMLPFNRQVATPAAKLNLLTGQALIIRSRNGDLRLVAEPAVQYEISITNEPPAEMASIDHFTYYYDFIGVEVTPYNITLLEKAALNPRPLVCQSVVFGKSQIH